jgi:hypothetical protein
VATVGIVWSRENVDFYGRGAPEERVALPQRGFANALIRARILSLPVHADDIERDAAAHDLALLVLPNIGALSEAQCAAIRRFVERGGGLLATGESSLYDEAGERRDDFALADLFGVHATGAHHGATGPAPAGLEGWGRHVPAADSRTARQYRRPPGR